LLVNEASLGTTSMAFVTGIGGIDAERNSWQYQGAKPMSVSVRKLDDCFHEMGLHRPAVLKLDVEGAEVSVLAGAESLLTRFKPYVLCEVHTMQGVGSNLERPVYMWIPNGQDRP
jgi:FkbM family methyltransferase